MIVTVVGNLCADPELRETSRGVPVADLRIAENRNYQDSSGRWQQSSCFYTVVVWRKVAEHVAASLHGGDRVVAVGRMRQEQWTTETGQRRHRYVVDADELAASVRFTNVSVSKAEPSDPLPEPTKPRDPTEGPPPFQTDLDDWTISPDFVDKAIRTLDLVPLRDIAWRCDVPEETAASWRHPGTGPDGEPALPEPHAIVDGVELWFYPYLHYADMRRYPEVLW